MISNFAAITEAPRADGITGIHEVATAAHRCLPLTRRRKTQLRAATSLRQNCDLGLPVQCAPHLFDRIVILACLSNALLEPPERTAGFRTFEEPRPFCEAPNPQLRTGTLDLHTNRGHPQRQVCACQKECVSCRVCVPIHRSSARLLLRWSSRKGCPFARRLIDWGFRFTRWTIGSVVVAPNERCKYQVVRRRRLRKLRLACARWKQMCVD